MPGSPARIGATDEAGATDARIFLVQRGDRDNENVDQRIFRRPETARAAALKDAQEIVDHWEGEFRLGTEEETKEFGCDVLVVAENGDPDVYWNITRIEVED